ncbi:MAG: zinc ABC transporter solute-binding protein, partial [Gammaproteobacteria bacterium]|nr:zinc ABC transporter solute-binding protein [Gammaproteobacteria bacterium]
LLSKTIFLLTLYATSWGASAQERLTVVATTSMIGDAVRTIVQDKARVTTLMGAGVDPHA